MNETKLLKCDYDYEREEYFCRDLSSDETYKLTDDARYESAVDLLSSIPNAGGFRDIHMLVGMLAEWNKKKHYSSYDDIFGEVSDCLESVGDNLFYCAMSGIEYVAKHEIEEEAEEKFGEEFAEWVRDNLDETYMYYNYLDWGCSEEPEEGFCNIVETTMMNAEVPEELLNELYERWKEEEGIEEEEEEE